VDPSTPVYAMFTLTFVFSNTHGPRYGFPSSPTDALTAKSWTLDVGGITSVLAKLFSGKQPAVMKWHTLNVGPEIMANPGETAVWELADFDVLV
jgi:hypothetical protein